MEDLFTNTFPLDGKIKLSLAGVSKNGFYQPEDQFPPPGIKLFFKNWISKSEKYVQIKELLFQVDRKLISSSRIDEFVQEYVSTKRKICFYW